MYRVVTKNETGLWPLMDDTMPKCNITEWNDISHEHINNSMNTCTLDTYVGEYLTYVITISEQLCTQQVPIGTQ